MNAVWFIFVVGLLNTGLGFAVAMYLGARYRLISGAGADWQFDAGEQWSDAAAVASKPDDETPRLATPAITEPDAPVGQSGPPLATEQAVEAFLAEVEQYQGQLDQVDTKLRSQTDNPEGGSIRDCLQSLLEAGREYVEQRERARDQIAKVHGEHPEFGIVCEDLQQAVSRQDQQIARTEQAISEFPYTGDLADGCRAMIGETGKLTDANLVVRDSLHEVDLAVARGEHRLADLEPRKRYDALTGTDSRAALEGTLQQWLAEGAEHVAALSVAAIDIDGFSGVNQRFGHVVGNQVLQALGTMLVGEKSPGARIARFSGERFILSFPGTTLRDATNNVERLRQIIEKARFDHREEEICLTVSCGVTEAADGDSADDLLARAETTLMEAKRYGRNRTFIHEGSYPTPVVPPTFSIESRRMRL